MTGISKKKKTSNKKASKKKKEKKEKSRCLFSCSNKSKKKLKKMKKLKKKAEVKKKEEKKKSTKKTVIRKKKKLPPKPPVPQTPPPPPVQPTPFPAIVPPPQPEPWLISQTPPNLFDDPPKNSEKDDGTISVSMKTAKPLTTTKKKKKEEKSEESEKEEKIKSPIDLWKKAEKTPTKKTSAVDSSSDRLPVSAVLSRPPEQSIHTKKFAVGGLSAISWEYEDSRPEETLRGERPNLAEFLAESAEKLRQPMHKYDSESKVHCNCCKCRFRSAMAALPTD